MSLHGEGDISNDNEDDLHRFVLEFRPIVICTNIIFALLFVALKIWPLVAVYSLIAVAHFCMTQWAKTHSTQLISSTPWMWFVFLLQFLFAVLLLGPFAGFQFYMIATVPALFTNTQWSIYTKILQTAIIALFFIACDVLFSTWKPIYPFDAQTIDLLHEINIIGVCVLTAVVSYMLYLTIKQTEQRFKRLASTDALTGLLNRRRMTEFIDKEYARSRRAFRPASLIICDIDHFKQINDRYGHDIGDQVLKAVGNIFKSLREYDIVARWGGEEFMVLLPDTDNEIAVKVAERLRAEVAQSVISIGETQISVTMTLGVAEIDTSETWQTTFIRADKALYRGKECGRNRVMTA